MSFFWVGTCFFLFGTQILNASPKSLAIKCLGWFLSPCCHLGGCVIVIIIFEASNFSIHKKTWHSFKKTHGSNQCFPCTSHFFKTNSFFLLFGPKKKRGVPIFWVWQDQVLESWSTGDVGCPKDEVGSQGGKGHLACCQFTRQSYLDDCL